MYSDAEMMWAVAMSGVMSERLWGCITVIPVDDSQEVWVVSAWDRGKEIKLFTMGLPSEEYHRIETLITYAGTRLGNIVQEAKDE